MDGIVLALVGIVALAAAYMLFPQYRTRILGLAAGLLSLAGLAFAWLGRRKPEKPSDYTFGKLEALQQEEQREAERIEAAAVEDRASLQEINEIADPRERTRAIAERMS